ncbi:MAG: DUF3520 domain-containing protein [Lachnospiraceae bacterium]|nr:DUF3520 domain-containing protein [Lachnospiraceae bacterium]
MKKRNCFARGLSFSLAGVLLLTGCGGLEKAGEIPAEENRYTEAAGEDRDGAYYSTDSAGDMSEGVAAADEAPADLADEATSGSQKYAENEIFDGLLNDQKVMEEDSYLDSCYEWEPGDYSGEEYSEWDEKGFSVVLKEPLSTFSADVDTASYSNLRRLIGEGYLLDELPDKAVRIEEMINYFSYDHKTPEGKDPFGVTTQISACPWNDEAELLMIGLKTEDIDYDRAPASNLVFLLDVSGSMFSDDKLPLLQESFGLLAENLSKKDRVSIVTYASEDKIVLDGVRGDQTKEIQNALNGLQAGGGTHGSRGIEAAYELAEENYIKGGNNRIILATDGDLNIGMTTEEELEDLITEKKESGIFLSVLGFGTGNIKDNKMEILADKGNGNYAYIDGLREANKVLVEELSATLLTICKDVKFQVEFNPAVVAGYRLLGYENRALKKEDFDDDTKDAGEIGAGHSVTALYEIILKEPLGDLSDEEVDDLKYSKEYIKEKGGEISSAAAKKEWLTISIRYKKPAGDKSNLLEYPVGYECYTTRPSDDFVFAAAVAEFGLLASHSEYPEGASVRHVEKALRSVDLSDQYKKEFLKLVQAVQ